MFKKVRVRLTFMYTCITTIVLIGMALFSLYHSEQQLSQRSRESFNSALNAILLYLREQTTIDYSWIAQTQNDNHLLIYIEDNGHPLLFEKIQNQDAQLAVAARKEALDTYGFDYTAPSATRLRSSNVVFNMRYNSEDYRAAVCTVPVVHGELSLTVLHPLAEDQAAIWRLRGAFALSVFVAACCLSCFSSFFTARLLRPVEESRKRQNEFVSAASHELRSPLAVMRASAGAMQNASPEQMHKFAGNIEAECTRLARLTNDLLTLASMDSARWQVQMQSNEPQTLLLCAMERFEPLADSKKISIRLDLPEEALPRCSCDAQRVDQLLGILLDNAISYTPANGKITLGARLERQKIYFYVADNGPGIPDPQKAHIFDRFYRADPSRSKKEHYGLGLSIAKEIVLLHAGKLTLSDAEGGGAVFTFSLPVENRVGGYPLVE